MFSGIVEEYATLVALVKDQENIHFTFKCSFVNELKIDQSISHNGVCLTVVSLTDDTYTVTAMKETLERSNLGLLKVGDKVNVERSMMMNGRSSSCYALHSPYLLPSTDRDWNVPMFLSWQSPYTCHPSDLLLSGRHRCEKYSGRFSTHSQTNT